MILRSITSRLVFLYCLLLVILGAAFLAFTVLSFRHYTHQTLSDTLAARAGEIWNAAEPALNQPAPLASIIERRFSPEAQDRFIRIHAGDDILYQSGKPLGGDFAPKTIPLAAGHGENQFANLLLFTQNFQDEEGRLITVDSGQSFTFAAAVQERLAGSLLVALPVLLLLAAAAGYILMRQALRPVEAMITAAEAFTFNDPHKRLPTTGTEPRIEALGLALNRMLGRLDSAYSHASRFSADAAHELRTPLTIIRGELELVASGEKLPSEVGSAISIALEEMTRLSGIVDNLITLSRMESLWGKRSHAPVDLGALATETIEQMNLLAEEKAITLGQEGHELVLVIGDRDRLKQVLVNLIDNAIKYTPQGGRVTVTSFVEDDHGIMEIEDTGIGIDPSQHESVFERFFRVTPDRGEVGAGLGLAIVRSICHAHGGQVTLRSAPQIGSVFRVELPLANLAEYKRAAAETATAPSPGVSPV